MTKRKPVAVLGILILSLLWFSSLSEGKDLYKILGVDKNASQRDIQKAFHKLSLKYHPDKNKEKSAQAKFEEINNAYEILSDEEKRKNYDLFGDEKGNQGFESGNPGGADFRSSQFNFGGQNGAHFSYGPKGSQAGPQGFQFFSFPFQQGSGGGGSFSFNFGGNSMADDPFSDIFSGMFGGSTGQRSANSFGNFGGPKGAYHRGGQSHGDNYQVQSLENKKFKSRVINQGSTWLLMFYNPYTEGHKELESILQQLVPSMQALVKVGTINCQKEKNLCKEQNVMLQKMPKIFVYSIRGDGTGSLLEYVGDRNAKDIKKFCFDLLPKVSKRINPDDLDDLLKASQSLPRVLLLTTKANTPAVWRALSGLHKDKTLFYDTEVSDLSNPVARRFRIKSIPAIIGILSNGDVLLLSGGSRNDQTESPKLEELNKLIESLEKENSKVSTAKRFSQTNQDRKGHVYLLTRESIDELCSEKVPLCIIGAYRSSEGKKKIQKFLKAISEKTLTRGGRKFEDVKDPLTYSILDGAKQKAFLRAFDKSSFKDADSIVIAFKPKRRTFAFRLNPASIEEAERFISGALNGDVHFTKVLQSPLLS